MNRDIPIIFVHRGHQNYLKDVIRIAQRYNRTVVLIGTKGSEKYCRNWIDADSLDTRRINVFKKYFLNYSPNTYKFEFGCFEKYFLLYEYVYNNNIQEFVLCDSDNLVFYNMSNLDYSEYDIMLNGSKNDKYLEQANCSFWRKEKLEDFICYIERVYQSELENPRLETYSKFLNKECDGQGISDMTLLQMWKEERQIKVWQMSYYEEGKLLADHNISCKEEIFDYDDALQIKKMNFINRVPFFYVDGKPVRTVCIHCQGEAKNYIRLFMNYKSKVWQYKCLCILRKLHLVSYAR